MIDILIFCGANNLDELIATIESIVKSDTKYINMLVKLPDLKSQENINKYISENYFKQKIEVLHGCDSGPENAINQLLSYAKSEYIQILPAGDLVCANYYDEVYKKIINNPDGECIFFQDYEGIDWHIKDYDTLDKFTNI